MRLGIGLLATAIASGLLAAPPAAAVAHCTPRPLCVGAGDGGFVGSGQLVQPGAGGTGPGSGSGPSPLPGRPGRRIERRIAPTCSGNSPEQDSASCLAAVSSCRVPGEVAYWVWVRYVDGAAPGPWQRVSDPPFVCAGGAGPSPGATVDLGPVVLAELRRYPLPRPVLRTEPAGRTLVRLLTNFSTGTATTDYFETTLVGVPVRIWARTTSWTWHFGDASVVTTSTPGRPGSTDVNHTYLRRGLVRPYVVTSWTGDYQPAGSTTAVPVQGTAEVVGPVTPLDVIEARSEYVS